MTEGISEAFVYPSHYVEIDGAKMHYIEAGAGKPIVFLHGIPTSAYVWRNVIPHLTSLARCIAVDLIGFGKSDKPNIDYSIHDHIHYLEKFIEKLNLNDITFVMHDWGSVIGFDYAMRHEKNCSGLVFYEAFLRSMNNDELSLPLQEQTLLFQNEDELSEINMNAASFVDRFLPQQVIRQLSEEEMKNYREPFLAENTGKPIVQYLKELHSEDSVSDVKKIIADYSKKLTKSALPKLMLYSVPGFNTTMATAMWAKEHLPNLEIVDIGEELHLAQESCPQLIGEAISIWYQAVEQNA